LRARGLKVSTTEWLTLMQALAQGMEHQSLMGFYQVCRCLVVKREADFDLYDQAFSEFFKDVSISEEALAKLLQDVDDWLTDANPLPELTDEPLAALEAIDLDELRRRFEERLAEQNERHDGGDRWIGTGGTSPFGNNGVFPGGLRVGGS